MDGPEGGAGDTATRERTGRWVAPGRELIDTLDAVRRYDFAARDLPGHGLKAVARHFGLAPEQREYVAGAQGVATRARDPQRVRHSAPGGGRGAGGVARRPGGAGLAPGRGAAAR